MFQLCQNIALTLLILIVLLRLCFGEMYSRRLRDAVPILYKSFKQAAELQNYLNYFLLPYRNVFSPILRCT